MRVNTILILSTILAAAQVTPAATVVYYNLTNPKDAYIGGFPYVETADELTLADGPRFFDTARVAYYGARFDGDETLTLTIYQMDGDPTPGSFGFNTPGTVLFSQTVPIRAADLGFATFTDSSGRVVLPNIIAVGLSFGGVDFDPTDAGSDGGPIIYDPPDIGSSFNDYWLRGYPDAEDPWALFTFDGNPNANFGLEISVVADSDGDGISDAVDAFPNSRDVGGNVTIEGCDTGVPNVVFADGSTISDLVYVIAGRAKNHGQFVGGVAKLKNTYRKAAVLTDEQAAAIQRCAAHADLP
jgi:hypothetical protein